VCMLIWYVPLAYLEGRPRRPHPPPISQEIFVSRGGFTGEGEESIPSEMKQNLVVTKPVNC